MFAKDDKKKAVSIIIAKAGKRDEKGNQEPPEMDEMESEENESGDMEGLNMAAEEILAALDAKDPKALAEALKSFMEMC